MKKIVVFLLFTFCVIEAQAQEQKWFTNVNEAMAVGNKENKPLLLFFTGSDWCGWCIRLQKEVLKTPEFAKWSKDNVVLVELDYHRKQYQSAEIIKQNDE